MPAPIEYEAPRSPPPPIEVPELAVEDSRKKTDNFASSTLIGEGSFGRVYYATLDDGRAVALKKTCCYSSIRE